MKDIFKYLVIPVVAIVFWIGHHWLAEGDNISAVKAQQTTRSQSHVKVISPAPNNVNPGDIEALSQALTQLSKEMVTLKQAMIELRQQKDTDNVDYDEEEQQLSGEEEIIAQLEEDEQYHQDRVEWIDSGFMSEIIDPAWASQSSASIYQVLETDEFANTSMIDMECRATLCRIEVEHDDNESAERFALGFPMGVSESFSKLTSHQSENEDGSSNTVIYAIRDGHNFSEFDPAI